MTGNCQEHCPTQIWQRTQWKKNSRKSFEKKIQNCPSLKKNPTEIEPDPYFNFGESNSFKYSSRPSSACVLISFPFTINLGFSSGFDFLSGPLTVLIGISVILNQNRLTGVLASSTRNIPRNIQ